MIKVLTGLPGAGKTLRMIALIDEAIKAGRPVYVYGVEGLQPGGWEVLDDPNRWQDLPDGSAVFIDEAQKVWPSRRAGDPIPPVSALSEHRHRGFDFTLTTQHPTMLDSYVRKLVGEHQHVVRIFGGKAARLFIWQEMHDDPQSLATRDRSVSTVWRYPVALFQRYKSASLHTVKARIPARLLAIPFLVAIAGFLAWTGVDAISSIGEDSKLLRGEVGPTPPARQGPLASHLSGTAPAGVPAQLLPYVDRMRPEVKALPWTAPAYADRAPVSEPDVYCISTPNSCTCLTEQGTRLAVDAPTCRYIARHGVYNPYRRPLGQQPQTAQASSPGQTAAPGGLPTAAAAPFAGTPSTSARR